MQGNDIILTITGYPGSAAIVSEEDLPLNINQHSVRFAVEDRWPPGFVAAAINSTFGRLQVERLAIGGTRDALDYTSVRELLIPAIDENTRKDIGRSVVTASRAARSAERLTSAAIFLVEALIEGRITEKELCAAQQALSVGCRDSDHAILAGLSCKGFDVSDEKTLFPNIDALYATVDEAERAHTEGETS